MMKKILYFLLVTAILGGGFAYYQWNKPHKNAAVITADISIDANLLLEAFESNADLAEKKYVDKLIKVNGTLKGIENGNSGEITLILATNNDMSSIFCNFVPDEHLDITQLKTGQNIAVKGFCSGYLMDVILERCAISPH